MMGMMAFAFTINAATVYDYSYHGTQLGTVKDKTEIEEAVEQVPDALDTNVNVTVDPESDVTYTKQLDFSAITDTAETAADKIANADNLTGAGFSRAQLEELGALVGSDVPYCVAGGTMLAEGRGERLTPVTPMPHLPVVICKPDFPISTPELFRRVDARTSRCRPDTEGICAALADGDMPKLARRMYNVFEDVLTRREGEIASIKSRLLDGGALGAVMSGTGSAVFGLFADADSAAYAKRRLARDYAECFLTETIDRLDV